MQAPKKGKTTTGGTKSGGVNRTASTSTRSTSARRDPEPETMKRGTGRKSPPKGRGSR